MNSKDVVVRPGVIQHSGTRYLGKAQRDVHTPQRGDESLEARAKKFLAPEKAPSYRRPPEEVWATVEAKQKKRVSPPVIVRRIKWEKETDLPPFLVNCPELKRIVKHLVGHRPSLNDPFYEALIEDLEAPVFAAVALFSVIERGEYTAGDAEEPLVFIRVIAKGREFILPNSFLKHCGEAFIKGLPR